MIRIGLTGGIGAGKSTVAAMLAERGAVIVDADGIARELVEPGGAALAELVTEFGPRILQADGSLSRAELASLAFSDPRATERLNAIMHPLIRAEAQRRLAAAPDAAAVVYDMPLLIEQGGQGDPAEPRAAPLEEGPAVEQLPARLVQFVLGMGLAHFLVTRHSGLGPRWAAGCARCRVKIRT